jgi:hypothetical protein
VNSDRYVNDILNPFFSQLTAVERLYGYFQQDNAAAHAANATMITTWTGCVSRQNNQQRTVASLDFCDFYLRGNLKGKVYKNNPRSIEAL